MINNSADKLLLHNLKYVSFYVLQGMKRPHPGGHFNHHGDHGHGPGPKRPCTSVEFFNPDSFQAMKPLLENITFGNGKDQLSTNIWDLFKNRCQRKIDFERKIYLWKILNNVLWNETGFATHAFGSTLNGYGSKRSDLDICLYARDIKDNVAFLAHVRRLLRRNCGNFLDPNIELVPAKVPILKMYDRVGNIEVDLSISNEIAVRNTHLLFWYSQVS